MVQVLPLDPSMSGDAGLQNSIISQSGMQLIYMASKGKLRFAHKILTNAFQKAAETHCNHLPDDIIQQAIEVVLS
jgi:MSHA biogenesis protein MshM